MNKNEQKKKNERNIILWTLIGIVSAAVIAFCIYCFAVVIPAKKEADRLALEEQRKQQELEQTMAPTATTVPTSKPTEAPIITEAPIATVAPTEVPDITEEPLPSNTPKPTATSTPVPTEVPHEHKWTTKEQPATCTIGGRTWDECECGEIQNEVILEALGHGKLIYTVTKEPTTEAEGKYEESCEICGTVVNKGNIKKIDPTPIPTATATPKPMATPTSTPIPAPTDVPHEHTWVEKDMPATCTENGKTWEECDCGEIRNELVREATGHGALIYIVTTEPTVDAEGAYEEVCEICGVVVNKGSIDKLAPTPTPSPTPTSTPTPTPTATPVPTSTPIPTPTSTPVQGTMFVKNGADTVENNASVTLKGTTAVQYTIFLEGTVRNLELECHVSDGSVFSADLMQGNRDREYTVKVQPRGISGKGKLILTMYGTNEYGERVACGEHIVNIKVEMPEDVKPRFTEDGLDFEGNETKFPGTAVTMDSVSNAQYELAVLNIERVDEYPNYRTKDNKKLRTTAKSDNASVVKASMDYANTHLPMIILAPVGAGTATVTVTLHTGELDELLPSNVVDTYTFTVTVEEYKSDVEFKADDYVPAENGFPYMVGEWQYGEDIMAQVWSNSERPYGDCEAVLVFSGTGAMWKPGTARKTLGKACPWNSYDTCEFYARVKTVVIQEGITRTEDISGSYVTKLSLPSSLKEIGERSFINAKITEVTIPAGVERIERYAFSSTPELVSVKLPDTLTYIGDSAFSWDVMFGTKTNQMKQIVIPKSVTYLGYAAFYDREGLEVIFEEGINTKNFDSEWDYGL